MIQTGEEIIAAICGGTKCGKTTLAKAAVRWLWRRHELRSIVFDIWKDRNDWGPSAWVTDNKSEFVRAVWNSSGCAVIWDESSATLRRNDDDEAFFTRIRHEHRAFFVLIHDFAQLTPLMRGNLDNAFIFRQTEDRARDWVRLFADTDLFETTELSKREFMHKQSFEKAKRLRPTLAQLQKISLIK